MEWSDNIIEVGRSCVTKQLRGNFLLLERMTLFVEMVLHLLIKFQMLVGVHEPLMFLNLKHILLVVIIGFWNFSI
jgi:hypothetical protein